MKQISGFSVVGINNGKRITYTYDEVDDNTGDLISTNNRKSFYAVNEKLINDIDSITEYINSRED